VAGYGADQDTRELEIAADDQTLRDVMDLFGRIFASGGVIFGMRSLVAV
jgi:hypothetical protein